MTEFNVGDRVEFTQDHLDILTGATGTVAGKQSSQYVHAKAKQLLFIQVDGRPSPAYAFDFRVKKIDEPEAPEAHTEIEVGQVWRREGITFRVEYPPLLGRVFGVATETDGQEVAIIMRVTELVNQWELVPVPPGWVYNAGKYTYSDGVDELTLRVDTDGDVAIWSTAPPEDGGALIGVDRLIEMLEWLRDGEGK